MIYAGCWRVQGDLAVSRAFGDAHLKPYGVSSTPELSAISLTPRDAFLVLASDGLWDVVDEQQCASSVLRASDPLGAARIAVRPRVDERLDGQHHSFSRRAA